MNLQKIDWSIPQRQPVAGIIVVIASTLWSVIRVAWPFLLIMIFRQSSEETAPSNRTELITIGVLALSLIGGLLRFWFFKFHILNEELIINKGWLKKETLVIPLKKIQAVHIEQPLLHQFLNIIKLKIDTAGSTKTEASIESLSSPMAHALKEKLVAERQTTETEEITPVIQKPIVQLSAKDLFRFSISSNHLETLFIIITFGFGFYENFSRVDVDITESAEGYLPPFTWMNILFLVAAILIIVVAISMIRIFLKFYDLTVFQKGSGYLVKAGLTTLKERLVTFKKIQFISLKANWIRRVMNIQILEYHLVGSEEIKSNMKVDLPITNAAYIPLLVENYFPLPETDTADFLRIHSSYIFRRFLIIGLFPVIIVMPIIWWIYNEIFFSFFLWTIFITTLSVLYQRKFKLWAFEDVLLINKGYLGLEVILLQWNKLQVVEVKQSIYQRQNNLATLIIHTASGKITAPFIPLKSAHQIMNFALYKTETSVKGWM